MPCWRRHVEDLLTLWEPSSELGQKAGGKKSKGQKGGTKWAGCKTSTGPFRCFGFADHKGNFFERKEMCKLFNHQCTK